MIVVAPLHELDEAIALWRPSHVVSLSSPGAEPARLPGDVELLRLAFHDIAEPGPDLAMATEADVKTLLSFGLAWPGARPLLIHCWAGVSRSPAAAYVVACARNPAGDEMDLANKLRREAPFATPNPHVVALADGLLGRGGAMTRSIATIGRGSETSLGAGFVLAQGSGDEGRDGALIPIKAGVGERPESPRIDQSSLREERRHGTPDPEGSPRCAGAGARSHAGDDPRGRGAPVDDGQLRQ